MQKKKPRTVLFKTSLHFISILLRLCGVAKKAGVFKGKYQHIVIINQLIQAVLCGNNAHFRLLYSCFCHIACPQINLRAGNVTKTAVEQAEMGVVSAQNSLNQLIYNYDMLVFTFENPSLLGNTTQAQ